jgi:hypothetical protein
MLAEPLTRIDELLRRFDIKRLNIRIGTKFPPRL